MLTRERFWVCLGFAVFLLALLNIAGQVRHLG